VQSDDVAIQKLHYPPGPPLWERSANVPSGQAATPPNPLVVYTQSTQLSGQVDASRRRLSDYLNDPSRSHLELMEVTITDLLTDSMTTVVAPSVTLRKAAIWLACPGIADAYDRPCPYAAAASDARTRLVFGGRDTAPPQQ
jgi:hypothetical protein